MKNLILFLFLFYILAILESSFLVHFKVFNFFPNLILISVVLINLFESPRRFLGISSSVFGGFFMDIFADPFFSQSFFGNFFGFYIIALVALSFSIKLILRQYIQLPRLTYG